MNLLIFILIAMIFRQSDATKDIFSVNFLGKNVEFSCSSSFAPFWTKIGSSSGDLLIIGANGKRHPNWNEPRYSFSNQGDSYSLLISDLRLTDAGKFVCGSDSPQNYVLSVMRYENVLRK